MSNGRPKILFFRPPSSAKSVLSRGYTGGSDSTRSGNDTEVGGETPFVRVEAVPFHDADFGIMTASDAEVRLGVLYVFEFLVWFDAPRSG